MGRTADSTGKAKLKAIQARELKRRKQASVFATLAGALCVQSLASHMIRTPMYDSERTGERHIQELLVGHGLRFYDELGMSKHVFQKLKHELATYSGFRETKYMSMEEQLAIFLRFCRIGLGTRVVREEFQRSADTVSRYCLCISAAYTS